MKKIIIAAAIAVVCTLNIKIFNDINKTEELLSLESVEFVALGADGEDSDDDWEWNNFFDWFEYGLRKDEITHYEQCPYKYTSTTTQGGSYTQNSNAEYKGIGSGYQTSGSYNQQTTISYEYSSNQTPATRAWCSGGGNENCNSHDCI